MMSIVFVRSNGRAWVARWAALALVLGVVGVAAGPGGVAGAISVPTGQDQQVAILENTVHLEALPHPAIDSAGITYLDDKNRLLISDSEIDEEPTVFENINLYEVALDGTLQNTGLSRDNLFEDPAGNREPTGLAYDPDNKILFVSNDSGKLLLMTAGADTVFGTTDDQSFEIDIEARGIQDAEDVAFDRSTGDIYVLDGVPHLLWRIQPDSNGSFFGSGVTFTPFDITYLDPSGVPPGGDPEGLGYRAASDTLLVVNSHSDKIYEITKKGELVRTISLQNLGSGALFRPSDVTVAPSSANPANPGVTLYLVDRGNDNDNAEPPPQDGTMYEVTVNFPNLTPVVDAGADFAAAALLAVGLSGSAIDDGQPTPNLTVSWSKVSGPGSVSFSNPGSPTSKVTFSQEGVYVLKLSATDGTTVNPLSDTVEVTVTAAGGQFVDDDGSVFEADIEWLAGQGITKGCGDPADRLFCPDRSVTRGQMAAFLVRALNLGPASSDHFTDDDGTIFEDDINRLFESGITKGCGKPTDNTFCPDRAVTRGQMAAFLVRAFGYVAVGSVDFVDDNTSIFEADIEKLYAAGVTKGCGKPEDNTYCPDNNVTRAQMAAFLHRALTG